MKFNLFSLLLLSSVTLSLTSCFESQDKGSLGLKDGFDTLTRHSKEQNEILKVNEDHIVVTTPLKYHLNKVLFLDWLTEIKNIQFIEGLHSYDLSKMKELATLEFKSKNWIHFIEIFSIEESFFLKIRLQDHKEKKITQFSGLINKKDSDLLLAYFTEFKSKGLLLPKSYKEIKYLGKKKQKDFNKAQSKIIYNCLKAFEAEKTIYHGAINSALAYKYSIGESINANITGFFRIVSSNKKNIDVYFGKPMEAGAQVRIWAKPSLQIREGQLLCFNKLKNLIY